MILTPQNKEYPKHAIRTFTGKVFDLSVMDPSTICIEDIAHGLSQRPRFAGQLQRFYSVAQHSAMAFDALYSRPHLQLGALLHDASEAYLSDMPSPFKSMMPDFKLIETNLMMVIASKFGFDFPFGAEIKSVDGFLLETEWKALALNTEGYIMTWSPQTAEQEFLKRYNQLQAQKK